LQSLFETQVDAFPGAISVSDGYAQLTYADLDARANRLAHLLLERGVGPGTVVGACLERSIEAIAVILAIVKAGGAYLPLDPRHPQSRRAFILENAGAILLVTNSPFSHAGDGAAVICLDQAAPDVARRSSARPAARTGGGDLAYVIYTSGSTGQPKGVAVPQRGVSRLVINTSYIAFSRDTVVAHVSNPAFDAATFDIWGPLLNGGRLEVFDEDTVLRPERLATALVERRVSAMFLTAALFHQTARARPDAFASLDTLLVGGDTVDPEACRLVLAAGPPRHLVNAYGPTETTTFATYYEVGAVPDGATTIPIGRPIANTRVYVLGPRLQPLPPGVTGEVFIGGPGVARGYVNLPELTARRFVPDPFSSHSGDRLFKTGDRARYRADGHIDLLGRMDRQFKIRGFRVEPAEIEMALLRHPHIAEAAVVFATDDSGDASLVAYLSTRVTPPATAAEVRQFLRGSLPEFMIPGAFVWMDRLPLTPNGKVDRSAMTHPPVDSRTVSVAPRTATERIVADIWAEHLRHGPVGVDDDFFGLGGHSLLAVKLIASIEGKCGVSLPLSLLFEAPTVAALARAIDERRRHAGRTSHVVVIQPRGANTPIFALPGGGGSVIAYGLLARALGDDQPFYGLEHHGLDGAEVPPDRVESVASGFVEDVLRDCPGGPCVLLGACSGAIVAFELARQLEEKGYPVNRVVMLDPSLIGERLGSVASRPVWRRMAPIRFVGRRLALYLRQIRSLDGQRRLAFLREKRGLLARLVRQRSLFGDSAKALRRMRVRESTIAALNTYSPSPYGGAVTLILGERLDSTPSGTTAAQWQAVCRGPLDIRRLGGTTSGEMLRAPLLESLVRHIKTLV
jgi:amino acid adenylation domain-containing protein